MLLSDDEIIELAVLCDDDIMFDRLALKVYPQSAVGDAHDKLRRWLQRRAVRRSEYLATEGTRTPRTGEVFTWVESLIITWAFKQSLSEKSKTSPPDYAYVAGILCRPVDEIIAAATTRQGFKGIF